MFWTGMPITLQIGPLKRYEWRGGWWGIRDYDT